MSAHFLVDTVAQGNAIVAPVGVSGTTMFLSDAMDNATTVPWGGWTAPRPTVTVWRSARG